MNKNLLTILFAGAILAALLLLRNHLAPKPAAKPAIETAELQSAPAPSQIQTPPAPPPQTDSFRARILSLIGQNRSPEEVAALLKELYKEDPKHLYQVLLSLADEPLATRQALLPLLAKGLTLWPEAEIRDVYPIADAYGDMDLPGAAQWAANYLATTGRDDLGVTTLLGRLAATSESQALALIAALPPASRADALNSAASHISLDDLNHLMDVCGQMDPDGSTSFSQLLFQRLGRENLANTAAWLSSTPAAQQLPGAVAEIGQWMVIGGNPQQAVTWANSLSNPTASGQATAAVFQQWGKQNPDDAIQNALTAYPNAPQVMADVFTGAANQYGGAASGYWETACNLQNPNASAFAIAGLIEPMLLASGLADTQAKIAALPANSVQQIVAEAILKSNMANPQVAKQVH